QPICNLSLSVTPLAPILSSFGPVMRFFQCLRRYYDTNAVIHLGNAGKYASTTISVMMIFYWRYTVVYYADDYNKVLMSKIIYIITQVVATVYANFWDLTQDWALLKLDSSNFLLRDELCYKHKWIYYFGMCNNTFLRFSWIFYFVSDSFLVRFLVAFGEVLRRWQWDIFRIENEHITNCRAGRAIKELELPTIFDPSLASPTSTEKIKKSSLSSKVNRKQTWRDFEPKLDKDEADYVQEDDDDYEEDDVNDNLDENDNDCEEKGNLDSVIKDNLDYEKKQEEGEKDNENDNIDP
ncbi:4114_t:CDS:2, partial [Dentiscutata erythropus]